MLVLVLEDGKRRRRKWMRIGQKMMGHNRRQEGQGGEGVEYSLLYGLGMAMDGRRKGGDGCVIVG
jgi:hypothetical protein